MTPKLASYLGLAQRAGGIVYGEDIIIEKSKAVKAVLIDTETLRKNKDRIIRKCSGTPVFETENLADGLHRDNIKAVGITNPKLAEAVVKLFEIETTLL